MIRRYYDSASASDPADYTLLTDNSGAQDDSIGGETYYQVRAEVPTGKKAGTHQGRVAVRKTGSFNIQTPDGVVQGIHHRHCTLIQRADGYAYSHIQTDSPQSQKEAARAEVR